MQRLATIIGPLWLRKDGQPRKNQCPNQKVWKAFDKWFKNRKKR